MPKVSLIMGAYNCEKSLCKCIESIMKQSFVDWEFIICDDCSTDNTYQILKKYAEIDCRIKIIQNERNSKLSYSLNHCLQYATGMYVARMDADDWCSPDRLKIQTQFLDEHPEYAVVGTAAYIFNGIEMSSIRTMKEIPTARDVLFGVPFMHPTIMMRKTVYDALNGYTVSKRTVRGQDVDLWFRFYAKGFQGYNLQTPLLTYHESSEDYRKRSIKAAVGVTKTNLQGYRLLKAPLYLYVFAVKPIVSALIPRQLLIAWHKQR